MEKRRWGVFAFGAVVLVASALIGASSAAADTVSQTTPMTYNGTNPCTGEDFTGTGSVTFTESSSLGTDGFMHSHVSTRINGLKAVTILTGKKYVVQDDEFDEFNFVGADEETFDLTVHYIRQGEDGTFILGDDFYYKLHTHITTNDAGMITSFQISETPATDMCQ
jgi:hypothetical protein